MASKYAVYLGKEIIGEYTTREIYAQFGIEKAIVIKFAYTGNRYRGHFRFVAVEKSQKNNINIRPEWSNEWDTVVKTLRDIIEAEKLLQKEWDNVVMVFRRKNNTIWRV